MRQGKWRALFSLDFSRSSSRPSHRHSDKNQLLNVLMRTFDQISERLAVFGAKVSRSRFKLNVSAGSQKRTIHKPEGRNESRFSFKRKRNIKRHIVKVVPPLTFVLVPSVCRSSRCVPAPIPHRDRSMVKSSY